MGTHGCDGLPCTAVRSDYLVLFEVLASPLIISFDERIKSTGATQVLDGDYSEGVNNISRYIRLHFQSIVIATLV